MKPQGSGPTLPRMMALSKPTREQRLRAAAERLEALLGQLAAPARDVSVKEALGSGAVTDGESTDLAAALSDRFAAESVAAILESRREQALHALDRLLAGAYGTCEECGRPIAEERLDYQPDATRCTACQARVEWARDAHADRRLNGAPIRRS